MNIHQERSLKLSADLIRWDVVLQENEDIIKRFEMTTQEYKDELERRYDDGK